jgi:hypothetical protein
MSENTQLETDLELLKAVREQLTLCERKLHEYVTYARSSGASWEQVGRALGVTKQSAWRHFAPLEDRPLSDPAFDVLFNPPKS